MSQFPVQHSTRAMDLLLSSLTLEQLDLLWEELGNVPLNFAEDGSTLLSIPGIEGSDKMECIDVPFFIWPRGEAKDAIWRWFDDQYARLGTCLGERWWADNARAVRDNVTLLGLIDAVNAFLTVPAPDLYDSSTEKIIALEEELDDVWGVLGALSPHCHPRSVAKSIQALCAKKKDALPKNGPRHQSASEDECW